MSFLSTNWWYIILAGVMIFLMFRSGGCCGMSANMHSHNEGQGGGCCGGHSHGGHNGESHEFDEFQMQNNSSAITIDPICGMRVDPDTAIKQVLNGEAYYFCSESCRKEFVKRKGLI